MEKIIPPIDQPQKIVLRILHILNRVPWPLKDGGALANFNAIKGLHEAGCDVTVCTLNTNKHFVELETLPDEVKALADWRATPINTDIKMFAALANLFQNTSYNIDRFLSKSFETLLIQTLNEKQFDVVVFESVFVAPYLDVVRKYSKALCVIRQHNIEHHIWHTLAANESNSIKRAYLKLLAKRMEVAEKKFIQAFDAALVFTKEDEITMQQMGFTKPILNIPIGIDLAHLTADRNLIQPHTVFHLGSMEWLPNQQAMEWFLEKVWPRVIVQMPDTKFYLAGRAMPLSFKKYENDHVSIIGEVEDAIHFMNAKQIMIVPLFAGSGMRVKILEGMALGKTIIATPLGAAGIAYEQGKNMVIAADADDFVKAIVHLLQSPQEAEAIGLEASQLANQYYDNTKVTARVLNFYQLLLKDKS